MLSVSPAATRASSPEQAPAPALATATAPEPTAPEPTLRDKIAARLRQRRRVEQYATDYDTAAEKRGRPSFAAKHHVGGRGAPARVAAAAASDVRSVEELRPRARSPVRSRQTSGLAAPAVGAGAKGRAEGAQSKAQRRAPAPLASLFTAHDAEKQQYAEANLAAAATLSAARVEFAKQKKAHAALVARDAAKAREEERKREQKEQRRIKREERIARLSRPASQYNDVTVGSRSGASASGGSVRAAAPIVARPKLKRKLQRTDEVVPHHERTARPPPSTVLRAPNAAPPLDASSVLIGALRSQLQTVTAELKHSRDEHSIAMACLEHENLAVICDFDSARSRAEHLALESTSYVLVARLLLLSAPY